MVVILRTLTPTDFSSPGIDDMNEASEIKCKKKLMGLLASCHIQSFRALGQFLKIPPFSVQKSHSAKEAGP
jgi:hypothetical protein